MHLATLTRCSASVLAVESKISRRTFTTPRRVVIGIRMCLSPVRLQITLQDMHKNDHLREFMGSIITMAGCISGTYGVTTVTIRSLSSDPRSLLRGCD